MSLRLFAPANPWFSPRDTASPQPLSEGTFSLTPQSPRLQWTYMILLLIPSVTPSFSLQPLGPWEPRTQVLPPPSPPSPATPHPTTLHPLQTLRSCPSGREILEPGSVSCSPMTILDSFPGSEDDNYPRPGPALCWGPGSAHTSGSRSPRLQRRPRHRCLALRPRPSLRPPSPFGTPSPPMR